MVKEFRLSVCDSVRISCLLQTTTCRTELCVSVAVLSLYSFIEHIYVNISQLQVIAPDYESPLHRCTSPCSMTKKNRDLGGHTKPISIQFSFVNRNCPGREKYSLAWMLIDVELEFCQGVSSE